MAGHDERDRVSRARGGHGADGRRLADRGGELGVRARLAARDAAERLEHAALERRRAQIQRDRREVDSLRERTCDPLHPVRDGRGCLLEDGLRVLAPEARRERAVGVAEGHEADAEVRGAHEEPAEPCRDGREADVQALAAARVPRGCRPEVARGVRVGAARRAVARLEARRGDGSAVLQERLETVGALGVRVSLRRDADEPLERPLEVERGETRDARERREGHALVHVRLEERDRPPDGPDGAGRLGRRGSAAQAGPETGGLGPFRRGEEPHVLALRAAGRAGRAAVNAGRRDGEDEAAVLPGIAGDDGLPGAVGIGESGRGHRGDHHAAKMGRRGRPLSPHLAVESRAVGAEMPRPPLTGTNDRSKLLP